MKAETCPPNEINILNPEIVETDEQILDYFFVSKLVKEDCIFDFDYESSMLNNYLDNPRECNN